MLARIAAQSARDLCNHLPEGCVIVEDVKDPEAKLIPAAWLLLDCWWGADVDHRPCVKQNSRGGKAKYAARCRPGVQSALRFGVAHQNPMGMPVRCVLCRAIAVIEPCCSARFPCVST